ncbi:MAG: bifunctional phosphopantothenoylcysteine decarboxylase/phosphopantothenate--cysteine ligase CoaBC [Ottowia sp.]|nr:bifunctional phosphopantothenoylcysteine decarboxylase/phosphopantothenate--cysteine ligase CoaBC [Ottowia sp.]
MTTLNNKKILIGLSGGIACYKTAELLRLLHKASATTQVVMTAAATEFITAVTLQALSGKPVYTDQWDARISNNMAHIQLSREADAMLIAPASADFLAKLTHGLCNDLLSTLCLARTCPLLVAPAMNRQMWEHPATQRNLSQLRLDGIHLLGPNTGEQACGENGMGRMLEPEQLLVALENFFQPKVLQGKHVLVTAGPTYEPIDPVRGITNLSSGKMGFAMARAAYAAGATVELVAGPCTQPTPEGVTRIDVVTAQQMYDAVMHRAHRADIFIATAAVADWHISQSSPQKIKKQAGEPPTLTMVLNPDILATVAQRPTPPYCVGFAAESEHIEQYASAKRIAKRIPLLVANHGPSAFGCDDNTLTLLDEKGSVHFPRANKYILAQQLISAIAQRFNARASKPN